MNGTEAHPVTPAGSAAVAPLLAVRDLVVTFHHGRHEFHALNGVSVEVLPGEVLAIVGESGAGKSTLGRAVLGLVPVTSGSIAFDGSDITHVHRRRRVDLARRLQAVFQDPYSSLNPARTVRSALAEPLLAQKRPRSETAERVAAMLQRVGLPADAAERYPRQFSGGQRQRSAIARALMVSPDLVICDEALSALDLSVQAQIINLLLDLRRELGLAYLFIAHDLAVVRHLADRVVVLRRGEVVEIGPAQQVCTEPSQPYTKALMEAAPVPEPREERARLAARAALLAEPA
jgi:ABC-type glutathione transport system ATPase component